jgi:hypothetical protein
MLLALACIDPGDTDPERKRAGADTGPAGETDADTDADSDTDSDTEPTPSWTLNPWLGIDGNAPIDSSGNIAPQLQDPALIASSGAGWVRINFLLGPWSSPEDDTPHGSLGLGWTDTYRTLVDGLVGQGLQVYGLIGGESVQSDAEVGSEAWLADYVYNFVAIVDRFKDDVTVYESFNEPNNWDATSQPTLSAEEYARLLQEVWLEVKHHNGHDADPSWQVTLVSGPLFTHDADTGASYLSDAFWYGRNTLAWDWTRDQTGSYPLDGVGMHLYVAQGDTAPRPIADGLGANLDALGAVIDTEDPGKPIWVSEVGWSSDYVGSDGQAEALGNALDTLRGDPRIAMVSWFCLVDWPGVGWGIRSDADTAKPAWDRFVSAAEE